MAENDEVEYLKKRIAWIDEHEKMFEISYCMELERDYCKARLNELEAKMKLIEIAENRSGTNND